LVTPRIVVPADPVEPLKTQFLVFTLSHRNGRQKGNHSRQKSAFGLTRFPDTHLVFRKSLINEAGAWEQNKPADDNGYAVPSRDKSRLRNILLTLKCDFQSIDRGGHNCDCFQDFHHTETLNERID